MKFLQDIIDSKAMYIESHPERVMRSAVGISNILKLDDKRKFIVRYASLLHDIGKVKIDVDILKKKRPLTKREWSRMQQHPRIGAEIVKKAGFLDDLGPAILYHHVRYEGGGYPVTDKKGNEIPIEARILAVADAYEAMISDRPYRRSRTKKEAISELKKCSGAQFDPKVVDSFLKFLNK